MMQCPNCGAAFSRESARIEWCRKCGSLRDVESGQVQAPEGISVAVTVEQINETEIEFLGRRCRLTVIDQEGAAA